MHQPLIICFVAAGLAGFIQGFSGFGASLVAIPLLLSVMDSRTAVPVASLLALTINATMVARLHGHIRRGPTAWLLAGSLPGLAFGAWILDGASDALIKGLLGLTILLLVADSLLARRPRRATAAGWAAAAGFFSGAIGLCTGAAGPPVIAWAARQPWTRDQLRATLTGYFLLTGVGIVGTQALGGLTTPRVVGLYAWSLPALVAGILVGGALARRVGDAGFRKAVLALLGALGAGLVWQAVA